MNQSNLIFAAIFIAFIVYITVRGELPTYWGFFVPNPNAGNQPSAAAGTAPGTTTSAGAAAGQPGQVTSFGTLPFLGPQSTGPLAPALTPPPASQGGKYMTLFGYTLPFKALN